MEPYKRLILEERCQNLQVLDIAKDMFGDQLRKQTRGPNYSMCCPTLHEERTPSFWIKPAYNFWKCYGCNQMGGEFSLPFIVQKGFRYEPFDPITYIFQKLGASKDDEDAVLAYARFLIAEHEDIFKHRENLGRADFDFFRKYVNLKVVRF